jgi:riboflavin synthase
VKHKVGAPCVSTLSRVFTGIVRERGRVVSFEGGRIVIESSLAPSIGDSISVDGTCLTVVEASNGRLSFDVIAETTARAKPYGSEVNLEPAVEAGQPLGGHYVQGHVDGVGRVRAFEGERLTVEAPAQILRYCVEKGSIAVDGVALTIAGLDGDAFEVALVPHTFEVTTLGALEPGDAVNVEVDILAKYVDRLVQLPGLGSRRAEPGSTET